MSDARDPWERLPREPSRAYEGFRAYRELPPGTRTLPQIAAQFGLANRTVQEWSAKFNWIERAKAWDDHVYRIEDQERLDAIRVMHRAHQLAGKLATARAIASLQGLTPADIPPAAAVRLLDLGTRLERQTLLTSVAELQGLDDEHDDDEDPWAIIARELTGT